MDGSFFAFALVGALVGWIAGDFQRERRYRREARANLAQSVKRHDDRARARASAVRDLGTDNGTDDDNDNRAAPADVLRGPAGRRAIPRPDYRARPGRYAARRDPRFADAAPVMVGGGDFDSD